MVEAERRAVSEDVRMTAIPKAQLMKETRQRRKGAGLISREYWATRKEHELIKEYFKSIKEGD